MQTDNLKKQLDPQPLNGILQRDSLHHLIQKARMLMRLDQILKEILPAEIALYCQVMNVVEDSLIVKVQNSAVATRVRFSSQEIISALKSYHHLPLINNLRLKVSS